MSQQQQLEYLERLAKAIPEHSSFFNELYASHQKKLWHQVTASVLGSLTSGVFSESPRLLDFFENYIRKLHKKINPLAYARIANAAQIQATSASARMSFLSGVMNEVSGDAEAATLIRMSMARVLIQTNKLDDAFHEIQQGKNTIDTFSGVMDAMIHSMYYCASMEYYKIRGPASDYFSNSMLYLTYTDLNTLEPNHKLSLALDIGTAALIGTNIYNFGELLRNPLMDCLINSQYKWLADLLFNFNNGSIAAVKAVWPQIKLNDKSNVFSLNEAFLNEKLRIMALMEMVFKRPSTQRTITFAEIGGLCDLPLSEVEWLLMKALALKVVKGEIDQVAQSVRITWVQPRVLDNTQLKSLRDNIDQWTKELHTTILQLEDNAYELLNQ